MTVIVFHINLHENCYSYDLYNALACLTDYTIVPNKHSVLQTKLYYAIIIYIQSCYARLTVVNI